MRVPPSPALTESFPTVWSLPSPPPPLRPRLTQRLTPGCIITDLDMLLVLMDTDIMVWAMVIIWVMLGIMDITLATMERGAPRLSQLPRLMPKLPQR